MDDLQAIKVQYGVAPEHQGCHTALVDGYVIEGHVPADLIKRVLRERPEIAGLSVPGMPLGSPGMEGENAQPYDVLAVDKEGYATVYEQRDPR